MASKIFNFPLAFAVFSMRRKAFVASLYRKLLIKLICRRKYASRAAVAKTFQTTFRTNLLEEVNTETEGNFKDLLQRLLKHPSELDAYELHEAMKAEPGTDENCLIEIICTSSSDELAAISAKYTESKLETSF